MEKCNKCIVLNKNFDKGGLRMENIVFSKMFKNYVD